MGNKANKGSAATQPTTSAPAIGATAATGAVSAAATPQPAPTLYVPGKYNPRPNTKHGTGGTAGTYAAICAAAQAAGGSLTRAQAQAVATANGDPGWVGYALNPKRRYLVPATSVVAQ